MIITNHPVIVVSWKNDSLKSSEKKSKTEEGSTEKLFYLNDHMNV